jgi:putative ABC transport system permease protein
LDIFDFPWLAGDPATALKDPNAAVLSRETAEKYFGSWQAAMGRSIKLNNKDVIKINGVLATIPSNTDFQLKVVISFGTGFTADALKSTDWASTSSSYGCYFLLPPNVSAEAFNKRVTAFGKKYKPAELLSQDVHVIESLSKVHYSTVGNYLGRTISPQLIRTLWLIAAFILIIACVNFINLATAQAVNRAKEIGVRKVLGSNKWQLKTQFILETLLIVVLSVLAAVIITPFALPAISKILEVPLSFNIFQNPVVVLFLLITTVVVTLLAGFYPSVVLSRFNPIEALKSKLTAKNTKGISLRRALVMFQFVIAQALIIGTLIIVAQMKHMSKSSLGFNKDAIVNVPFPEDSVSISKLDYLQKKLYDIKGIQNVSLSSNVPISGGNSWTDFTFNNSVKKSGFYVITKFIDAEYVNTYQMKLAAGRNIAPSDTAKEILVNEAVVKALGFTNPADVLNKPISIWDGEVKGLVVGVLKDFNSRSYKDGAVAPVLMTSQKKWYTTSNIKLATTDLSSAIASIEKLWGEVYPDYAFEYQFLDDKIANFYKQETQLSHLYKIFAAIAIFLSCLGLYGLASFMAVQRIKEVGIRKVLGATVQSVIYLFSKEFIILISIAFVVASPIAWYFMNKWLQDFSYRIDISWWMFLVAGAASMLIALITVSFQAIKAAIANPIKSLRKKARKHHLRIVLPYF